MNILIIAICAILVAVVCALAATWVVFYLMWNYLVDLDEDGEEAEDRALRVRESMRGTL